MHYGIAGDECSNGGYIVIDAFELVMVIIAFCNWCAGVLFIVTIKDALFL